MQHGKKFDFLTERTMEDEVKRPDLTKEGASLRESVQKELEWARRLVNEVEVVEVEEVWLKKTDDNHGGSSDYYKLPEGAVELADLIEFKNMNFNRGNVFKASYRMGGKSDTDELYDWYKIRWFAEREIARLEKLKGE